MDASVFHGSPHELMQPWHAASSWFGRERIYLGFKPKFTWHSALSAPSGGSEENVFLSETILGVELESLLFKYTREHASTLSPHLVISLVLKSQGEKVLCLLTTVGF